MFNLIWKHKLRHTKQRLSCYKGLFYFFCLIIKGNQCYVRCESFPDVYMTKDNNQLLVQFSERSKRHLLVRGRNTNRGKVMNGFYEMENNQNTRFIEISNKDVTKNADDEIKGKNKVNPQVIVVTNSKFDNKGETGTKPNIIKKETPGKEIIQGKQVSATPSLIPTQSPTKPTLNPTSSTIVTIQPTIEEANILVDEFLISSSPPTISVATPPSSMPSDVSFVLIKFSVLMAEDDKTINSEELSSNQDKGVVLNLIQTSTRSLCSVTDFKIIAVTNPNRNLCDLFLNRRKNRRNLIPKDQSSLSPSNINVSESKNESDSKSENKKQRQIQIQRQKRNMKVEEGTSSILSFDPFNSVYSVDTQILSNETFFQINLRCGLEEVGSYYKTLSEMSFGIETPRAVIESTVQNVIDESIESGAFFRMLEEQQFNDEYQIRSVSVIGDEESTFIPVLKNIQEYQITAEAQNDLTKEYTVKPIHSLRMSGIIMCLCTISISVILFHLGSKRQKERQWMDTNIGDNDNNLHLSSEDDVVAMLNVGRRKTIWENTTEDDYIESEITSPDHWQVMTGDDEYIAFR